MVDYLIGAALARVGVIGRRAFQFFVRGGEVRGVRCEGYLSSFGSLSSGWAGLAALFLSMQRFTAV